MGAFIVLSSELFPYNHNALGAWLVVANLVIIVLMPYLGAADMRKQEVQNGKQRKLKTQLLKDKSEDKCKVRECGGVERKPTHVFDLLQPPPPPTPPPSSKPPGGS